MDLNKKEIIYELAKGVHGTTKAQTYGHIRRRLMEKQGISEIALYSSVADHLQENDIYPGNYIGDMKILLELISENMFVIKTDDRFSYLRDRFASISMENSPEAKGQFLCARCFTVKNNKDRAPHKNYKTSCEPCYRALSKESASRYQKKIKSQKTEEVPIPKPEKVEENKPVFVPVEETPPVSAEEAMIPKNTTPFIEIESLTADSSEAIVSLSCKTLDLSKLLLHIDPFLIVPEEKNKETEEKTEEAEE